MSHGTQAVVTAASGRNAETLDHSFLSFARNRFAELHAFIIGDRLPERRFPEVNYHLVPPDPAFSHPMRDLYYRRWQFLDRLDAEHALVVDNNDVLCMQDLPEIPHLLRGAIFAGCVEHEGGRYLLGQGYTSAYLNCGVTFWNIPASRPLREEIVARGRRHFRSVDDQLSANEVIHTRYYDQIALLPSQYNFRPFLAPVRGRHWPTVDSLDGVVIYHNARCLSAAKALGGVPARARLPELPLDSQPLNAFQQWKRRVRERLKPHIAGQSLLARLLH